jgi:hypothetical protein
MVKVGDTILINKRIEAIVTALFMRNEDNRWIIGYRRTDNEKEGYFPEGDEEFNVMEIAK